MPKPSRRIVTGHDEAGHSILVEDGPPPRIVSLGDEEEEGAVFHEIWHTRETPAPIDRLSGEPDEDGIQLAPPKGGTRIRLVDFPPDDHRGDLTPEEAQAAFAAIGAHGASTYTGSEGSHPFMHRTETIDYGIVLEGEITLVLDREAIPLSTGDIVIQRGTSHAWSNRSDRVCRMAFVLIDGKFEEGLA